MVLQKHRTTSTCPPQSTSFLDILLVQETLSTTDTATAWIRSATTRPTGDTLLRQAPHLVIAHLAEQRTCSHSWWLSMVCIMTAEEFPSHSAYSPERRKPITKSSWMSPLPSESPLNLFWVFLSHFSSCSTTVQVAYCSATVSALDILCRTSVRVVLQSR